MGNTMRATALYPAAVRGCTLASVPSRPALGGIGRVGPKYRRIAWLLQLRLPCRCARPQADDVLVLPDVLDPHPDRLFVGTGDPSAAARLCGVWIFHRRRFFVDADMAAGTLSYADASDRF